MRSVFGLLVALSALFLIWLWATGRFDAAWKGITSGSSTGTTSPADTVNLNPFIQASQEQLLKMTANAAQTTPNYLQQLQIPVYVPTVGSAAFGIP